ncbi:TPA: hypothetical protein DD449_04525 [Candidatus Berkelbacteria bacterium]|nr:hypothetical protein [Candidatus Berkelbacteria bacterium]
MQFRAFLFDLSCRTGYKQDPVSRTNIFIIKKNREALRHPVVIDHFFTLLLYLHFFLKRTMISTIIIATTKLQMNSIFFPPAILVH